MQVFARIQYFELYDTDQSNELRYAQIKVSKENLLFFLFDICV